MQLSSAITASTLELSNRGLFQDHKRRYLTVGAGKG
jgi:hypothetical protein